MPDDDANPTSSEMRGDDAEAHGASVLVGHAQLRPGQRAGQPLPRGAQRAARRAAHARARRHAARAPLLLPRRGRRRSTADHLVRGYELDDGEYVVVTDEELEALDPKKSRDIDLRLFVPADELDPIYFERPLRARERARVDQGLPAAGRGDGARAARPASPPS